MLNKHDLKHKQALSLQSELNKLYDLRWKVDSIPLETPIQHGFVKTLEFHDDVKRRQDFPLIKECVGFLGIINVYHPDKSFTRKIRRNRITTDVTLHPHIGTQTCPSHVYWYSQTRAQELIDTLEKFHKYLRMCGTCYVCSCEDRNKSKIVEHNFKPHYSFKFPSMMKEVVYPHFLTHYKPVLPEVETRIAEIQRKFECNRLWDVLITHRRVYDKICLDDWMKTKYADDRIYHSDDDL
jgi:hypothetical protein